MGMDKGKREKEIFDLLKKNQIQLHLNISSRGQVNDFKLNAGFPNDLIGSQLMS